MTDAEVEERAKKLEAEVTAFRTRTSAVVDVRRHADLVAREAETSAFNDALRALTPEAMGFLFRQECPMFAQHEVTKLQCLVRDEVERRLREGK